MRAAFAGLVAAVGLIAVVPAPRAALLAPAAVPAAVRAPDVELVAGGCGRGYHRAGWRDRYGHWHRRCVPNRYY